MSSGEPRDKPAHLMTLAEVEAAFANHQWSDHTPLTDEERAKLRARLNAAGGADLRLTLREQQARAEMGIIRTKDQVVGLFTQVRDEKDSLLHSDSTRMYGIGILAAIEWATGAEPYAPITGGTAEGARPTTAEMRREAEEAEDAAKGRRECPRGHHYPVGVEHTILWLLARTDDRPWSDQH